MKLGRILGALLVVASVLGVGLAAPALAQAGNTTIYADDTFSVSNQTQSVYVEATNTSANLTVTVYGIDDGGLSTEIETATLDASAGSTALYEYSSLEPATYPEYRVQVSGPENTTYDSLDLGTIEKVSGGGGIALGGSGSTIFGIPVAIALITIVAVGAFVWMRD